MTTPELMAVVKKNPIPFACGILSLALAVAIYFRSDAIPDTMTELDERSGQAHRYALNITNGVQLKEQLEAITAANKDIEARLIHASQLGINQQFFYKLEADSGVKLTDVRQLTRPAATGGTFQPIGFALTVQGDFPSVINFLQTLESGTHFCRVLSATCTGGRTGPVTLVLNIDLLGRP